MRWHRDLVRRRWAKKSRPKNGRPATHRNIKTLVLRMARQNPAWGCRRIHGELAGWASFLRSQAEGIVACDFFTADLLDGTKVYALAVIE